MGARGLWVVFAGIVIATPVAGLGAPIDEAAVAIQGARALAEGLLVATPGDALRIGVTQAGLGSPALPSGALGPSDAFAALGLDDQALAPGLRAALGPLLSATAAAMRLHEAALAGLSADEVAFLSAHLPDVLTPPGAWAVQATDPVAMPVAARPATDAATRDRAVALAGRVDVALLAEAAAILVDAAIASVPALETLELPVPPGPVLTTATPCAVLVPPLLCIKGAGIDSWDPTQNYYVAIDLAGNDAYTNSQGAGASATGYTPVAVLIDVSGNDVYTAVSATGPLPAAVLAQGAGSLGVGVLLDVVGDDTYIATATAAPPPLTVPAPSATVVAQGAGAVGAGALVDLAGLNSFLAASSTLGGAATTVAQGAGALGAGILAGGGNGPNDPFAYTATSATDLLLVVSTPTSRTWALGVGATVAQGAGALGAGVLIDTLGRDTYAAHASGGRAGTVAQGGANGGAGLLVDSADTDSFSASTLTAATLDQTIAVVCPAGFICSQGNFVDVSMGAATTVAQGAGGLGVGLLADLGGFGASYTATATSAPTAKAVTTFAGGGGAAGTFTTRAIVRGEAATVDAHGYGGAGAGVLLADSTGADLHSIVSVATATAIATNTDAGAGSTATATATGGDARGFGQGYAITGVGILENALGGDTYSVTELVSAVATATNNGGPGSASATPGAKVWAGRGHADPLGGLAVLLDIGGLDSYGAVPPSDTPGTNNGCWTQSPPGLPGTADPHIGMGIDADVPFTSLLSAPCFPVPPN